MESKDDWFERWAATQKPHPVYAQVFLEATGGTEELRRASGVLEEAGVHIFEERVKRRGSQRLVTFFVDSEDLRKAVLRLTEAGFRRLIGISPRRQSPASR